LAVARKSAEVLVLAAEIAAIGNTNALSDAGVAGSLAIAAIQSAALNVKVNGSGLADKDLASRWQKELNELERISEEKLKEIHRQLRDRAQVT
jgi:formiminotetrahydrofolate cyclodeaminase